MNRDRQFELADSIAELLLDGVTDKHGVPIIIHCRSVCNRLIHASDTERIVALLHEVLEDGHSLHLDQFNTKAAISNMILILFGPSIHKVLTILTRDMSMSYTDYIQSIVESSSVAAIRVKLADLEDNLDERRGVVAFLEGRYRKAKNVLTKIDIPAGPC